MQCREVVFKEQEKHKLKMKTRFGSQGIIQNVFLEKKTMFEKSSMAGEFPLHGKCLKFSPFFRTSLKMFVPSSFMKRFKTCLYSLLPHQPLPRLPPLQNFNQVLVTGKKSPTWLSSSMGSALLSGGSPPSPPQHPRLRPT